ncbi:hypothetical protein ACF0H5_020746 [Mactra antiquata]
MTFTMSAVPHINVIEDILSLSLAQCSSLAKSWQIDTKGCKSAQDVQGRIIEYWLEHRKSEKSVIQLDDAVKAQQNIRDQLFDKYGKAQALYGELTPKIKHNLEQSHPGLKESFESRKKSLKSGEITIVVAGEVGAGKTSFINLLLGTQMFPTDALKCTNTICEIRSSDREEAVFYFKPILSDSEERQRRVPEKVINLHGLKGIQEFKDSIAEYDQNDDNPYNRCDVYYPFKTLSKGVVIVDTPGIEGGMNVDQRLQRYLNTAFGFIYVINTNAAGGVQKGRLGHLLSTVVNSCDDFSPEASLFIGNKWEHVPEHDKPAVQNEIFKKIGDIYPGLAREQLHFMSVKQSADIYLKYGARLSQHDVVMKKVSKLIPCCLRQGMISNYNWLSTYLSRAIYLLRVSHHQHAMSREELEKQFQDLRKHVQDLQKNADDSIKRLRDKVNYEIFKITNLLQELLRNPKLLNSVCDWKDVHDCPAADKRWKSTADAAAVKISERLSRMIDGWQREKNVLKAIDSEIIGVFRQELGLMDNQIQELEEGLLSNRRTNLCKTMKVVPVKAIFTKRKKKIERTYSTLGGAVSCIGMLDTDKKQVRNIFRDYSDKNKSTKMAEATAYFIETIVNFKDFGLKLKKFFDRFFRDIDEAANRIPGFLNADQQLIETLKHTMEEGEILKEKLPVFVENYSYQKSSLDIFFINDVMSFDYEPTDLRWSYEKRLGSGSFADVYAGKELKKGRSVALKISNVVVGSSNVTDILTEDKIMRDLKHPNIVRYYGNSYERLKGKGLKWIMIMEMCKTTLKHLYMDMDAERSHIPGVLEKTDKHYNRAVRSMLNHALQLCRGLEYIHEKGYTHRDMKLENVLVSEEGIIKITDVGVAKQTEMLLQTCNGSPAYMAPEVLNSSSTQSNKIDIYSTSFMFWEMWFGKDVADEMNMAILTPGFCGNAMDILKDRVAKKGGWRPPMTSAKRPPDAIVSLIKRGWDHEPEMRPTAKELVKAFESFLANN